MTQGRHTGSPRKRHLAKALAAGLLASTATSLGAPGAAAPVTALRAPVEAPALPLIFIQGVPPDAPPGPGDESPGTPGDAGADVDEDNADSAAEENRRARRAARTAAAPAGVLIQAAAPANQAATNIIIARLQGAEDRCGRLPGAYLIDCLAGEVQDLADKLPRQGDYAEAQQILDRVAGELDQIARSNRDRRQPRLTVRAQRAGERGVSQSQPIEAVRADRLERAEAQATQAIQRAQVTLLRSVASGDPRQVHYQRIASAFDDAAVLLRS